MRRNAKIRILAWLMIVCLVVPDLSLDVFAAEIGQNSLPELTEVDISDDNPDDLGVVISDESFSILDIETIEDACRVGIKGRIVGNSSSPVVDLSVNYQSVRIHYKKADFSRYNGVFYEFDDEFTLYFDANTNGQTTIENIYVNGVSATSVSYRTLTDDEDDRNVSIGDISIDSKGKTNIEFVTSGVGYSIQNDQYIEYRKVDEENNPISDWNKVVNPNVQLDDNNKMTVINSDFKFNIGDKYEFRYYIQKKNSEEVFRETSKIIDIKETVPNRKISLDKDNEIVGVNSYKAKFKVTGDGSNLPFSSAVYLYDDDEKVFKKQDYAVKTNKEFKIDFLQPSKEYKAAITISSNVGPSVYKDESEMKEDAEDTYLFSFKTAKDDRTVELVTSAEQIGCSEYNVLLAQKGSYEVFENYNYNLYYEYKYKSNKTDWIEYNGHLLGHYADIYLDELTENTTYEYSLIVKKSKNDADDAAIYAKTGKFTTLKNDCSIEIVKEEGTEEIGAYHYSFDYVINGLTANELMDKLKVAIYYKEEGSEDFCFYTLLRDVKVCGNFNHANILNLKANKKYEIKLVLLNSGVADDEDDKIIKKPSLCEKIVSIKTLADDRKIVVDSIKTSINTACVNMSVKGTVVPKEKIANYVMLYREKGSKENFTVNKGSFEYPNTGVCTIEKIEDVTDYEYILHLVRVNDDRCNSLFDLKTGNVKSQEEMTDEEKTLCEGFIVSSVNGTFSINDRFIELYNTELSDTTFYTYLRINGPEGVEVIKDACFAMNIKRVSDETYETRLLEKRKSSFGWYNLDIDTDYEYTTWYLKDYETDIDGNFVNVILKTTGNFKTLKEGTVVDDRKPVIKDGSEYIGRNEYEVSFNVEGSSPKNEKLDEVLCYYYKKAGDKDWINEKPLVALWDYDTETGIITPAKFNLTNLMPGTEYEYKVGIAIDSKFGDVSSYPASDKDLMDIHTTKGSFVTAGDDRKLVMVQDSIDAKMTSVKARFFVNGINEDIDYKDIYGQDIENPSCEIILRYRAVGSTAWNYTNFTYYYKNEIESGTVIFNGLTEKTDYEVEGVILDTPAIMVNGEYNVNFVPVGKFSTIEDDRAVVLANAELSPYYFNGSFELTGKAATEDTNWLFVWQDDKGDWHSTRNFTSGENFTSNFMINDLVTGKTYKYKLAVGKNYIDPEMLIAAKVDANNRLEDKTYVLDGSFVAPSETRIIGDVSLLTGFGSAELTAKVLNNYLGLNTKLYLYYREKGKKIWNCDTFEDSKTNFAHTYVLKNLMAGTEYEYILAIYKDELKNFQPENSGFNDGVVATKSGTFTLDAVDYSIEFTLAEDGATYNSLKLNAQIKSESNNENLILAKTYLLSKNETDPEKTIMVESKFSPYYKDFTNEFLFEGLEADTTYKIAKVELFAWEAGKFNYFTTFENIETEFATKKASISKLSLIADTTKINAGEEGFNTATVTASVPEGEASDVIFTLSGNHLGTVTVKETTADSITVEGAKPGKVKVMAVSKYNGTVKAEIELEVAEVRLYWIDKRGTEEYIDTNTLRYPVYKDIAQEFKMYVVNGFEKKEVYPTIDVKCTPEGIVSGGEKTKPINLTGIKTGYTDVVFEYNGFKTGVGINSRAKYTGYAVSRLDCKFSNIPAIEDKDGYIICDNEYTVKLVASPDIIINSIDNKDFYWKSSDEKKVPISNLGVIDARKTENNTEVTITATPKYEDCAPIQFKVTVRSLPAGINEIYAYSNLKMKKLSDIKIVSSAKGWEWSQPKTSLASLEVGKSYEFDVEYKGNTFYPFKSKVKVNYGVVKGIDVNDNGYNKVVELSADGKDDTLDLHYSLKGTNIRNSDFEVVVSSKSDLTIRKTGDWSVNVQAAKPGNYTLKADVFHKATNTKIATSTYKFTVVKESVASRVVIEGYQDNVLVAKVDTLNGVNEKLTCLVDSKKDFRVVATAYDVYGEKIEDAKYAWSITDKKVASLGKGENEVVVKSLNEGNAFINVKVRDKRGITEQIAIQVRDFAPKFDTDEAKINLAYDYATPQGRALAADNGGLVGIAEASSYDDKITSVAIYEDEACTNLVKDIALKPYSEGKYSFQACRYLVVPSYVGKDGKNNEIVEGDRDIYVKVATKKINGADIKPVKLHVTIKMNLPTIKAKTSKKVNLFYKDDVGKVKFTAKGLDSSIRSVEWDDGHSTVSANMTEAELSNSNSFAMGYNQNEDVAVIYQNYIKTCVNKKKIVPDKTETVGTINVYLDGYKEPVKIEKFKIAYDYKAAKIQTKFYDKFNSVCTELDMRMNDFYLYDKTQKSILFYDYNNDGCYLGSGEFSRGFQMLEDDNENIDFLAGELVDDTERITFDYLSNKKNEKANLDIISAAWRDKASAKFKVKNVKPKAVLAKPKLVFNSKYSEIVEDQIIIKNVGTCLSVSDVEIKPNGKAKNVLSQNAIEICVARNNTLQVVKNHASDSVVIPKGRFSFAVTPTVKIPDKDDASENDVENEETYVEKKLNKVKLSLTITDKLPTVKAKITGKLDVLKLNNYLTNYNVDDPSTYSDCRLTVAGLNKGYTDVNVGSYVLTGAYKDYFQMEYSNRERCYLIFLKDFGKVRSKFKYKVNISTTIRFNSGESISISSKPLTISTTQKSPKLKVKGTANFYTSSNSYTAVVDIEGPKGYKIYNPSYSEVADVIKDNYPDFYYFCNYDEKTGKGNIVIRLNNFDGVVADKTYKLPIYVQFIGTDGIQKGITLKVKATINR